MTHRDPTCRRRDRGQQGVSLVIVIAFMGIVSVFLVALIAFSSTATKSAASNASAQTKRFAADSALKAAINYVAKTPDVGRDTGLFPGDPACGYRVPASQTGSIPVTVTCAAVAGAKSGAPVETGKVPDYALLLLGQRYGDVPSYSPCTGSLTDRRDPKAAEVGLLLDSISLRKSGGSTTCVRNANAIDTLTINGKVRSNAPVRVNDGQLNIKNGDIVAGSSPLFFGSSTPYACTPNRVTFLTGTNTCTRTTVSGSAATATDPNNPGETLFTDPAREGATDASAWRQGIVNWSAPKVSINGAPPALLSSYNEAALTSACNKNQNVMRFYPGLYTSAGDLNRIFGNSNCSRGADLLHSGIYWFGPAENDTVDFSPTTFSLGVLAASGTPKQGVYAFDFRDSSGGIGCGALENTNYPHRWCVKANPDIDGGPTIVGGWPKDWDPTAVNALPGNSTASSQQVTLSSATAVDTLGANVWDTPDNARTFNDGTVATYRPTLKFSTDRPIQLSNFGSVSAVQSGGKLSFSVRHQESRSANLSQPKMTLSTTDRGTVIDCGAFNVPKSTDTQSDTADALQTNIVSTDPTADTTTVLTDAQRNQIRSCFQNGERIRKWQVLGDSGNRGSCGQPEWLAWLLCPDNTKPRVFLDGIQISVESPTGGFFNSSAPVPAVYCDDTKPGVQFIFGGDSTIHLGTGALQICAGPPPVTDLENYQQIAVWGQPQNFGTVKNGSSQTLYRMGKLGKSSLVATTATSSTSCPTVIGISTCLFGQPTWRTSASLGVLPGKAYTPPTNPNERPTANWYGGISLATTTGTVTLSGFGKLAPFTDTTTCAATDAARSANLCYVTGQTLARAQLKVNYNSDCAALVSAFCLPTAGKLDYTINLSSGAPCTGQLPSSPVMRWFSLDVTSCLDNIAKVNSITNVSLKFNCNVCTGNVKKLEGAELIIDFNGTGNVITPATGCKTGQMGFGSGVGDTAVNETSYFSATQGTDCALISGAPASVGSDVTSPDIVSRTGRVSVLGTIYAPSDALEMADGDIDYPLASRGVVARHLRVRAAETRPLYGDPMIDGVIDKSPFDRQTELAACIRQSTDITTPCGSAAGDKVLARAGVRFTVDTTATALPSTQRLRLPIVEWWNSEIQ